MAFLSETDAWEAGIYQLETTDPVEGGPAGKDNVAPRQLANRTLYLKNLVDALGTGPAVDKIIEQGISAGGIGSRYVLGQ